MIYALVWVATSMGVAAAWAVGKRVMRARRRAERRRGRGELVALLRVAETRLNRGTAKRDWRLDESEGKNN